MTLSPRIGAGSLSGGAARAHVSWFDASGRMGKFPQGTLGLSAALLHRFALLAAVISVLVTGAQKDYATFPTNSMTSLTAMPDGIAFDKRGNLYVTDGSAPVIWRVPRGGGEAKPWLIDPALPSAWASGLDGVAIDPSGHYLYFTEGYVSGTGVYRVPLSNPSITAVQLVHLYGPPPPVFRSDDSELHGIFGVSAIAFSSSGKLYVTLMGANQVSVLRPDGSEQRRFPDLENPGPYDAPLFPAFDGHGYLLITNLAIRAPEKSAVLRAWVDDKGLPLVRPPIP